MTTSKEKQTWREQRVTIKPQQQETVYFNDTAPNHILMSNSSSYSVMAGTTGSVTSQTYDTVVQPYGTRLLPSMLPTTRLYLYNSGDKDATVVVKSWVGEFNPAAIAQSVEMVGAGMEGLLGIVDVNNILAPLPPGNNVIGGVMIADYAKPLPTGNNLIGRVSVDAAAGHAAKYKKVTATVAGNQVVKIEKGVVYKIAGDVTLYDGVQPVWVKGSFDCSNGVLCETNITLKFDAPGDAYIIYS